jgi:hypothetical protein
MITLLYNTKDVIDLKRILKIYYNNPGKRRWELEDSGIRNGEKWSGIMAQACSVPVIW